jgi:hypothetical protein
VVVILLASRAFLFGQVVQTAASQESKPNIAIASAACAADLPVDGDADGDTDEPDVKPADGSMQITVLGPDDKPLSGAKIHASVWTKEPFQANRDYVCDAQGRATVELPKSMDILRLWASKDGHVSLFANWWPKQEFKPRKFPREFTFRLENGTVIGGIVKNDDGDPIEGTKVWVRLLNPNREAGLDKHPMPNV